MTDEEKKEFEEFLKWKAEKAKQTVQEKQTEQNNHSEPDKKSEKDKQSENPAEANRPQHNSVYSDVKKESNPIMYILVAAIAFIIIVAVGLSSTKKSSQSYAEEAIADSVEVVALDDTAPKINVVKEINRDSIASAMKKDYTFKRDEFSSTGGFWVEPKFKPKYRNVNSFYCYFWINDYNYASNFRFVMQYESDSWLFIENCVFNIDGENYTYIPKKMERDNYARIWEWFDDHVDKTNLNLVRKIANAKSVKVKLNGRQYYDTRTIKAKEIASIKQTLTYYEEIGGEFD